MDKRSWGSLLALSLLLSSAARAAVVGSDGSHDAFAAIAGVCGGAIDAVPAGPNCVMPPALVFQGGDTVDFVIVAARDAASGTRHAVAEDAEGEWAGATGAVRFLVRGGGTERSRFHFPPLHFTPDRSRQDREIEFVANVDGQSMVDAIVASIQSMVLASTPEPRLVEVNAVPLPAGAWLLAAGMLGLSGFGRRHARMPG